MGLLATTLQPRQHNDNNRTLSLTSAPYQTKPMRYTSGDALSDMIVDRRHEAGWAGSVANAGRVVGRVLTTGGPLSNLRKSQPGDDAGTGPLPLPTTESPGRWQSLEDMYSQENFYEFGEGEAEAVNQMQQFRQLALKSPPGLRG